MRYLTNLYSARNVCLGQTQLYNAVPQSTAICHSKISMNLKTPSDALLLNLTDWNLCSNGNRLLFEIDSESNIISLGCWSRSLGTHVHHCFSFSFGILSCHEKICFCGF